MTTPGRVAFVTHGGPGIGLGHVKRCLALARSLSAQGADVIFLVGPDESVSRLVERSGFGVSPLEWEGNPSGARRALQALGASTVVVDSYAAMAELFDALRPVAAQIVAVDDVADRYLPVDVVINGGVGAESLPYRAAPDTLFLLGPQYALIDPRYATRPDRGPRERIQRVLVALGGSPHTTAARMAVTAADAVLDGVVVDVVLGPYAGSAAAMNGAVRRRANRAVVHGYLPDLRALMLEADVAIAGGGMTLYELAATATPSVTVMTEPNQARNVEGFERAGAAVYAGRAEARELGQRLEAELRRLAEDPVLRKGLGAAGRRLVDGEGTLRVARELACAPSPRR